MNWMALSPGGVAAAWAALAGVALWLYLHHRRPQRRRVSTLRFWVSVQPITQPRRRRLREPWALLAQVLFLLLLILALADLRWGNTFEGRSVVIVFDTSIWSQAHPAGTPSIDREREETQRLLNSLPEGDRVLLLRAETDAPPILPFTTNRAALHRAVAGAQPSGDIANIPGSLEMGRAALAGSRRGLIVYVGPGMLDDEQARGLDEFRASMKDPSQVQFLVRLVGEDALAQNRGITHLSLRRDAAEPDRWHLLTQLKNYGDAKSDAVLKLSINGQPIGQRMITLGPNELANAENDFTWDKGGLLQAEISPSDALEADDRAIVNLPTFRTVQVGLFAEDSSPFVADLLPVLLSNPYVRAEIVPPGNVFKVSPDVAVYQGRSLPSEFAFNSIWFLSNGPPSSGARSVRVMDWNSQHPVTRWVRTHDVSVRNPTALQVLPGDTVLAYAEGNPPAPLILAREQDGHRLLIIGFDPHDSNFPQESAFPLLMAGGIEWMTHSVDEVADSLSTGELDLPEPVTRVVSPSGKDVPFARSDANVHLLALQTGIYRIIAPGGEKTIVVNTPPLPTHSLTATATESAGVEAEPIQVGGSLLWRWLVLLAIVALWLEWWLYYRSRERQRTAEIREPPSDGLLGSVNRELEEREESESRKPNFVA